MLMKRYLAGDFDEIKEAKVKEKLKVMRIKFIVIGTKGWQASSDTSNVEEKLME